MKARIIGSIIVLAVLGALFVLTEGNGGSNTNKPQFSSQPNSSDNAFKDLKIN